MLPIARNCLLLFILMAGAKTFGQQIIFPYSTNWKYSDQGINLGTAWRSCTYDDNAWASGTASFGYGDDVITCIKPGFACGSDPCNPAPGCTKYSTYYFRKTFSISDLNSIADFTMNMIRDDGVIVWVNGVDVWRSNITNNNAIYATLASRDIDGSLESVLETTRIASSFFVEGTNCIAVEVHQSSTISDDLRFSLELIGNPTGVSQGPYLQVGSQTGITIRWKTNAPVGSRVDVGTTYGSYVTASVIDPVLKTDHEVRVDGLVPGTKYFYRVGSDDMIFEDSSDMYFFTAPADGSTKKIKVAVFGDCGINHNGYRTGSINAYKNYVGSDPAELLLLLGDNAYNNGTEVEYRNNFFIPMGPHVLRNHVMFPAPGNHDYDETGKASRSGAYYRNFTMPSNGESGGISSGTEAYYSFDWGDIHFISLDSYGTEADNSRLYDTLGPQVTWVKKDLAATNKKWKIVYWHHPPYTKGTRNSDTEEELINIRKNFIRILERNGVDMVLCGHSHNYERSYLLKGHYDAENTFQKSLHTADSSSGRYDGSVNSCPYILPSGKFNHGTVYVISGSSGADGIVQPDFPHEAMPFAFDDGGMFYFEVDKNRLDAKFLRMDNTIADQFTIMKDVNVKTVVNATVGEPVVVAASWPGTYHWSDGASTEIERTFTPSSAGNTELLVSDDETNKCLTDTIIIHSLSALPVKLIRYTVQKINGEVYLKWSTSDETQNHSFIIERSSDGSLYSETGRVVAEKGNIRERNYTFIDKTPMAGQNFYRLLQLDNDGRITVLGIRSVITGNTGKEMDIFIPFEGSGKLTSSLKIYSNRSRAAKLMVYDITGRKVFEKQVKLERGITTQQMSLEPGMYAVTLLSLDAGSITKKFIIK